MDGLGGLRRLVFARAWLPVFEESASRLPGMFPVMNFKECLDCVG